MVQQNCSTEKMESQQQNIEEEVAELMANGKKYLLCSDYNDAVTSFQSACELLSEKYGELGVECAECYYYYGVSLLEMARLENGVLGNALRGVPEEDSESEAENEQFEKPDLKAEEREKLRLEVEDAMATENEDNGDEDGSKTTEKDEKEKLESVQEKGIENPKEKTEDNATEKKDEKEDKPQTSEETTEEDPDDVSNMQLAWEMLECAKVVYKKKEQTDETILRIAQCHLKLGELGLEVESYAQAATDFLECLVIQKDKLPETDRKLAETHYNLGLAYNFQKRYDNALEHYKNALDVLESRIDLLNQAVEETDDKDKKEIEECKEIGEIKELIPDINSKIEDVISAKRSESRLSGSPFRQTGESSTGFGTTEDKPCSVLQPRKVEKKDAGDIDHLVRRKRPSSDVAESEVEDKKSKKEENGNGVADDGKTVPTNLSPTSLKKKNCAAGDAPAPMET